ncbi:transglutaminase domain-containing protein [Rufibacter psychrotolerans]|uniref:transglutaminase domain-containing protein n=1 Tax=Rufibacter psychrotolerans TaxID=2812556 RepID=UPI00196842CD|nr:transglutaminase domain-containing protein [Rufibacter sp. SYSU D00308]
MRKLLLLFLLLSLQLTALPQGRLQAPAPEAMAAPAIPAAQTRTTHGIAQYINQRYKTPQEKIKAIYFWLAINIAYDVQGLTTSPRYYERQALIRQTLQTRKALCQGYAEVFLDLCTKTGLKAHLITGFVIPSGTSTPMSHAWGAAQINGKWYLFDPTWGAGLLQGNLFVPRVNPRYFMVPPATMVKTHLPFDPLWQLLPQPLTYQEFLAGQAKPSRPRPTFHFLDSVAAYEASSDRAKLRGTLRRMEANPVIPAVVLDQLNHLKQQAAVMQRNDAVDQFNAAVNAYNAGIDQLNGFIRYRNNQFQPQKSVGEIRKIMQGYSQHLQEAQRLLQQIHPLDNTSLLLNVQSMHQSLEKAFAQVAAQEKFLEKYLRTPPAQRKALFYKQAVADSK